MAPIAMSRCTRQRDFRSREGLFGNLPSDVLWNLFMLSSEELIVVVPVPDDRCGSPCRCRSIMSKVTIHNELMPKWYYLAPLDLARMASVCKPWEALASQALVQQIKDLVAWGRDCPAVMHITVPRPLPGSPVAMEFSVEMANGKCVSITRPWDLRGGESFEFDYRLSETGAIKMWVVETHDAPQPRATRGRPSKTLAQQLHNLRAEVEREREKERNTRPASASAQPCHNAS